MNDDVGCVLLIGALLVLLVYAVAAAAVVAGVALVYVGVQVGAVWVVLYLTRDQYVLSWSGENPEVERAMVVFWLTIAPVLAGMGCVVIARIAANLDVFQSLSPTLKSLMLPASGLGGMVAYYVLYFKSPPYDTRRLCVAPQWLRFVRAQHEIPFLIKLKWIKLSTQVKLWLIESEPTIKEKKNERK